MGQGKDRDVNIYVRPLAGNPGKYEFSMDKDFGADEELTFDKSEDGMWKSENYRVTFNLQNQEGANLKFSKRLDKVLWAEATTLADPPCPGSQKMDNVFWVKKQNDIDDLKVVVTNRDPTRERFIFAFNFLPATVNEGPQTPDSDYILYDPIGNNQNGGWPRSLAMPSLVAAGGAVVGAVATMSTMEAATTMSIVTGAAIGAAAGFVVGLLLAKRDDEGLHRKSHA